MENIYVFAIVFFSFIFLSIFLKIYSVIYIKYFDKKYGIKKATVVPIRIAKTTSMPINCNVIEIITEEPFVVYT